MNYSLHYGELGLFYIGGRVTDSWIWSDFGEASFIPEQFLCDNTDNQSDSCAALDVRGCISSYHCTISGWCLNAICQRSSATSSCVAATGNSFLNLKTILRTGSSSRPCFWDHQCSIYDEGAICTEFVCLCSNGLLSPPPCEVD